MSRLSFIKISLVVLMVVLVAPSLMASEDKVMTKSTYAAAFVGQGAVSHVFTSAYVEDSAMAAGDTWFRQAATTNVTATFRSSTTTDYLEIVKQGVVTHGGAPLILSFGDEADPAWRQETLRTGTITVETEGAPMPVAISTHITIPTLPASWLGLAGSAQGMDFALNGFVGTPLNTGVAVARVGEGELVCDFTSGENTGSLVVVEPDNQVQRFLYEIWGIAPADSHIGAVATFIKCNQEAAIVGINQDPTTQVISTARITVIN